MSRETTPSWRSRSASPSTSLPTPWPQAPWPTGCPIPPPGCSPGSLERWVNWRDHGGDVETVVSKDDLCTHATIYWVTNTIGTSIRTYANNHRYPWTPSHDRQPPIEAPLVASPSSATRTHPASAPTSASSTSSRAAPGPAQQPTPSQRCATGRTMAATTDGPVHRRILYRLTWLAAALSLGHHLDHLIRGNAVGWPLTDQVNAFTISLVVWALPPTGRDRCCLPGQLDRALLRRWLPIMATRWALSTGTTLALTLGRG